MGDRHARTQQHKTKQSHSIPNKHLIVGQAVLSQNFLQLLSDVAVVRLLVEVYVPDVLQQHHELVRKPHAQLLRRRRQLLLQYFLVLLFLVLRVHVLPRQLPQTEIDQHVDQSLDVVPPPLLDPEVGVDGGVSGGSGEIFVVFVGDVLSVFGFVLFGESKVNHEDCVGFLGVLADEEVVWFDVPVNEALAVDVLDAVKDLESDHDGGFEWEIFVGLFEKGLEALSEEFHDHDIFLAFGEVVDDFEDSAVVGAAVGVEVLENFVFVEELWVFAAALLNFESELFVSFVNADVNFPERPGAHPVPDRRVLAVRFHMLFNYINIICYTRPHLYTIISPIIYTRTSIISARTQTNSTPSPRSSASPSASPPPPSAETATDSNALSTTPQPHYPEIGSCSPQLEVRVIILLLVISTYFLSSLQCVPVRRSSLFLCFPCQTLSITFSPTVLHSSLQLFLHSVLHLSPIFSHFILCLCYCSRLVCCQCSRYRR